MLGARSMASGLRRNHDHEDIHSKTSMCSQRGTWCCLLLNPDPAAMRAHRDPKPHHHAPAANPYGHKHQHARAPAIQVVPIPHSQLLVCCATQTGAVFLTSLLLATHTHSPNTAAAQLPATSTLDAWLLHHSMRGGDTLVRLMSRAVSKHS